MKTYQFFGALAVLAILAQSCGDRGENNETVSTEDNSLSEAMWEDVGDQAENSAYIAERDSTDIDEWGNCATITFDTTPGIFPNTITLDFGETNCTGRDGRERRGKIIYTITAPFRETGASITTTTDDYYVNDYKVEGTRTVTNDGEDSDGAIVYNVVVTGATITAPDGNKVTWESERTRKWIEGQNTGFFTWDSTSNSFMGWDGILDDVYTISGEASGVDRNGRAYEVEITSDLRVELTCNHIVSGTITLEPEGLNVRTLDYGNGDCDDQATVTVNDKTYEITLRGG